MQGLRSVTKEEFESLPFAANVMGPHPLLHEVHEWWVSENRIGVVILDKVDNDWSFAALAKNPSGRWQGYASDTSMDSINDARAALHKAFEEDLIGEWWAE